MQHQDKATPVSRLATQAVDAAEHHERQAGSRLADACSQDEFIARAMRRAISNESAHLERGLTVLASVGSVAPFVGLFGTVWGIYHALASISFSGQATLDKVAGPVGEALIMTALGLAVAIPAVLAYNALVRSNRMLMGQVESFGHDLHTLLTTGATLGTGGKRSEIVAHKQHAHLKDVSA
jgi:biopolymer transport protein ExbB